MCVCVGVRVEGMGLANGDEMMFECTKGRRTVLGREEGIPGTNDGVSETRRQQQRQRGNGNEIAVQQR